MQPFTYFTIFETRTMSKNFILPSLDSKNKHFLLCNILNYCCMAFTSHGKYEVSVKKRLLVVDATGPWNLEAAQRFDGLVRSQVSEKLDSGSSWGMIALLHGQSIYTQEATPILEELHPWRVAHGLRHIAIVHSDSDPDVNSLTNYQFDRIYESDSSRRCVTRYFTNKKEAFKWLGSFGYLDKNDLL